ncbi:NAD-dependent succinate-semialdehyde dehydrogenase [Zobellella denitrificans]|jgi:succinate-semialdehyde dehydrogenase/glutarate-semialdehyde dehydrogenase|uniref:Succinate-semialdehyde dehydrogenase n=1 Tax=Zobellella denitrificans TaxID=347534 RepID=A0A291HLN9_9GAMM|nr:NAD-dependent succinate-semialdehyde dehydrogenase [Zobellella denitrificans]ATG73110.1 succinate-semialdehyde dehydrogenase [Zobellella denitrificans]
MDTSNPLWQTGWYCDGQWRTSPDSYEVRNPASGEVIARVARCGGAETDEAIAAAERALVSWRKTTPKERGAVLRRWYELMMQHQDELAELMVLEQGKPLTEAKGEVAYAASFLEWFAEEAKRAYGETIPSPRQENRLWVVKEPVGVIAAITPWNFPFAMLTRKVGPAIAAGCTAVAKASEETPLCANALAVLAERAGMPPGVLNLVSGDAPAIGEAMMASPAVRKLSFTGSTRVGKLLMARAADTVKKLSLELGGNAPFIVFDDADLDAAVAGALASKFRNTGQTCVCVNRFFVQDGIYDAFVSRLAEAASAMKVADGLTPGAQQGPLINPAALAKVERHVADALAQGGQLVCGGARHELGGTFYQPTVIREAHEGMQLAQEETFGPVAACFRFQDEAEAVRRANATPFGLAAYFYTKDLNRVIRVAEALESGMVGVNEGIISNEVSPFGGVKESGLGREGARIGLEEFLETKYINLGGLG